ncbi:DMT family transporter [Chitinophaga sp. Cy-1792]|uniref:DMT family transporter n=1 Tax=Chitinophaga sp. Cy-1792 TaxID=2608339 RepID=UPI00141E470A|nr:DMT family transporter [Chitinophaga sp. Cy-1792]NIG54810.1 DMT family transporter [Chitinophaga sp. Cy-1792]
MRKSFLLLHTSILLAGFTGIFGKLISLNEISLVWFRLSLSFILLLTGLKLSGRFVGYGASAARKMALSGILPALAWVFFYASIKYGNISVAVICFCMTGFFTAVLGPVIQRRKLIIAELLLSLLTVAGIGLIFHFDTAFRLGIILGVISSLLNAFYIIANEGLVKRYEATMINYYQMLGGTVAVGLILPFYVYAFPGARLLPDMTELGYLLLLASFCTIGIYVLVAEALKQISAFTVNLCFNLEPVYSIILAMLFFNEGRMLGFSFYVGLTLILASVVLQMFLAGRNKSRNQG